MRRRRKREPLGEPVDGSGRAPYESVDLLPAGEFGGYLAVGSAHWLGTLARLVGERDSAGRVAWIDEERKELLSRLIVDESLAYETLGSALADLEGDVPEFHERVAARSRWNDPMVRSPRHGSGG